VKIGLIPVNIGFPGHDIIIELARQAEAAGVESLWTFEHVVVPLEYQSKYPYDKSGKMGITAETNFVDPLVCLAAIAAATSTVRLGTGVNILSQANPVYVAKQAASLDFMSGGRFMLGAGIGWLQEEFDAVGVPFERRGARFDDYVQGLRKVWSGDVVEHQSEFISWSGFKSYPLPVQKRLPIIIGGDKGKVYQRIARYGDGWYAPTRSPEDLAPRLEELKNVCAEEGRDYDELEITAMWTMRGGLDELKAYRDLGVARLNVMLAALGLEDPFAGIGRLHEQVISKIA
jgi:probable F420-dependent oxidoreductase